MEQIKESIHYDYEHQYWIVNGIPQHHQLCNGTAENGTVLFDLTCSLCRHQRKNEEQSQ